jgi:hypothetical protein
MAKMTFKQAGDVLLIPTPVKYRGKDVAITYSFTDADVAKSKKRKKEKQKS